MIVTEVKVPNLLNEFKKKIIKIYFLLKRIMNWKIGQRIIHQYVVFTKVLGSL